MAGDRFGMCFKSGLGAIRQAQLHTALWHLHTPSTSTRPALVTPPAPAPQHTVWASGLGVCTPPRPHSTQHRRHTSSPPAVLMSRHSHVPTVDTGTRRMGHSQQARFGILDTSGRSHRPRMRHTFQSLSPCVTPPGPLLSCRRRKPHFMAKAGAPNMARCKLNASSTVIGTRLMGRGRSWRAGEVECLGSWESGAPT